MILDMKDGAKEVFPNFKGGEKEMIATMYADEKNKILFGRLAPGASVGYHQHEKGCEVMYILTGKAKYETDEGVEYGVPGQSQYCPEGHFHSMTSMGPEDLTFFAVVPLQ